MRNLKNLLLTALVAASISAPSIAQQTPQNLETFRMALCNVDHVAVLHDRMHIKCGRYENGNTHQGPYYAMQIAGNEAKVDAIVKLAIASKDPAGPKPMRIWYRRHAGGNPPGCDNSDCRQLVGVAME